MAKRDRDWFRKMAPKGFRIRMMEPGEAPALQAIRDRAAGGNGPAAETQPIGDFVLWLLQHEVFVAEMKAGEPVGFAAAGDLGELYWLAGLYVLPEHRGHGIGRALTAAVVTRAGWFFHRALGLSTAPETASFFERSGFVAILPQDFPPIIFRKVKEECPDGIALSDRAVMVKWL